MTPFRKAMRLFRVLVFVLPGMKGGAQSANTPLVLPSSVAYDAAGNLYLTEAGGHVVRRLTPAGVLTVVAGTGTQGFAGDGGPATAALLDSPMGVTVDGRGDVLIADTHNHRVRRVDALTGIISTYATAGLPVALAFDGTGALVVADAATHQVVRIDAATGLAKVIAGSGTQGDGGDGGLATGAMLDTPAGLAFDVAGNLYLADAHNHRVRRVDAGTGVMTTVAGTGLPGFSGDQGPAIASQLDLPRGLSFDAAGNLYLADSRNQRIRRVDAVTGVMTTIAGDGTQGFVGDGGPAASASLDTPRAVTNGASALTTLADTANNRVRQVDGNQNLQTIAGKGAVTPARSASTTTLVQTSSVLLAASVSATGTTPTGTVSLIDGTTLVASATLAGGAASFGTGLLSVGSHTLTAAYAGNAALLPSISPPLIVTVADPATADFTLTIAGPATVMTPAGDAAMFTFAIGPTGAALSSPIALAVAGVPAGATASFNPAVIPPPSGPSTFTLTVDTPASARLEGRGFVAFGVLLVVVPLGWRRRRGWWLAGLVLLVGCGARVNPGSGDGVTAVSYNVVVSATATGPTGAVLVHTAQVTLVVD